MQFAVLSPFVGPRADRRWKEGEPQQRVSDPYCFAVAISDMCVSEDGVSLMKIECCLDRDISFAAILVAAVWKCIR